jgi:hypothetical protein
MRKLNVDRCTRLVGVALLISAGFSAGMRHAHPGGGGWNHHHEHAPEVLAATEAAPTGRLGWFSTPLHMHIFILGFQFTLPADENSSDESTEKNGADPVVMRLAADDLADSSTKVPVTIWNAVPIAAPLVATNPAPAVDMFCRLTPLSALPLCESARHERSGVQRT